jgi:hypothetical protein
MLAHPTTTRTLAIPKTEFSKINPETVAYFSTRKSGRQFATNHRDSTTNSPSKNHVLPPVFAKTPCKTKNVSEKNTRTKIPSTQNFVG